MTFDQTGNLLGALSLVVADRTTDAIGRESGLSESQAVTLSALYHFLDRPSVDLLGRVLGLTSSGTVRLVDRLVARGLVTRGPGPDGRTTTITLTPEGRRAGARVTAARAGTLEQCLAVLDPHERATLRTLLGKMLSGLVRPPGATRWICRLCDTEACGREEGLCPVAQAALGRPAAAAEEQPGPRR